MVRVLTDAHWRSRFGAQHGHVDDRHVELLSSRLDRRNEGCLVIAASIARLHHEADCLITTRERQHELAPVLRLRDSHTESAVGLCIHRIARMRHEFVDECVSTEFLQEVASLSDEDSVIRELTNVRDRFHRNEMLCGEFKPTFRIA